jgi:hypothetical protein
MPFEADPLPPEKIVRVREQYVGGTPTEDIQREHGITKYRLYDCLDGGPVVDGKRMFEPLPLRSTQAPRGWGLRSYKRAALVRRLWQAADGQVRKIECRLAL